MLFFACTKQVSITHIPIDYSQEGCIVSSSYGIQQEIALHHNNSQGTKGNMIFNNICKTWKSITSKNSLKLSLSDSVMIIHQLNDRMTENTKSVVVDYGKGSLQFFEVKENIKPKQQFSFDNRRIDYKQLSDLFTLQRNLYRPDIAVHDGDQSFYVIELRTKSKNEAYFVSPYIVDSNFPWALVESIFRYE